MNYLIIVALAFLAIFIAFKWNNIRTKMAFYLIALGIAFLLIMGFLAVSGNDLDSSLVDKVSSTIKVSVAWLGNAVSNVVKISSYAIEQKWDNEEAGNKTR